MATEISCPRCGARYLVKEDVPEGRRLRCRKCGEAFSSDGFVNTKTGEEAARPAKGIDLVGRKIGGCRIEEMLGKGGMGVVYRARHLALDIPVAVKILPPQFADSDSTFTDRFIREARAAARLQHQNIVGVLNVGRQGGLYYIIMQFVDGESLEDRIEREGRLGPSACLDIMLQLCAALKVACRHKIVHRDIKPDNILIDREGVVKLADLGLAKSMEDRTGLTQSGIGMGTPHYMAPEQAADVKSADRRSDIYSLGCTLFRMLTGRLPFEGESGFTVLTRHMNDPVPDPHDLAPDLPAQLVAIVRRMMAKNPDDRYQTPGELAAALEEARRALTTDAGAAPAIAAEEALAESDAAQEPAVPPPSSATPPEPVISESDAEDIIRQDLPAPAGRTGTMAGRDRYVWGLAAMVVLCLAVVVAWAINAMREKPQEPKEPKSPPPGQHAASVEPGVPAPPGPPVVRREPPPRRPSALDGAKGSIRLSDWSFTVGSSGGRNRRADLATTEHSFKDGILRVRNTTGKQRASIYYSAKRLAGDFMVELEVKGAFMFSIVDPDDRRNGCVVGGPPDAMRRRRRPGWTKVVLRRENGVLECTVDGIRLPERTVRGNPRADGFLWINVRAESFTEIRSCALRAN